MLTLLDTALGRIALGLLLIVLAFGAGWLRGHNRGYNSATMHYKEVVAACLTVNGKQDAAIEQLQEANAAYAHAAAASQAQAEHAAQVVAQQATASAAALTAAQRKLNEAEHANPDAVAWSAQRVPVSVGSVLRN